MEQLASSIVIVLPPAVAVLISGLVAVVASLSTKVLSYALHLAAGVVLGVVGIELMPRALETTPWLIASCFMLGGLVYLGITAGAEALGPKLAGPTAFAPMAGLTIGVGFDMVTDGTMIAAGQNVEGSLGLLLSVGLMIADSPEAFSTVAALRNRDVGRRTLIIVAVAFAAAIVVGAPLGEVALRGRSDDVQLAVLAFTAGMLVLVVVEGLVPEAHAIKSRTDKQAAIFLSGFTAFALLSLYLG